MQVWVSRIQEQSDTVSELDGNGKILFSVETIVMNCQKLMNMYRGVTHPDIYDMYQAELEVRPGLGSGARCHKSSCRLQMLLEGCAQSLPLHMA